MLEPCAISRCTAQIARHVKITPYLFTSICPRRTWNGPKKFSPTDVIGGFSASMRRSVKLAIFCWQSGAWQRWQLTHFSRTLPHI